ncbi:GNAT family N-acetyltransferase [Nocardioides sp.]|uniref:GNAT family N-acetyltransferase n=1 Tax=Nocardioides sp. TaxID=35761 RepID=UPI002ECFECC8
MTSGGRPWWARLEERDGVLLRRLSADDAPAVLAVHGDPRVYVHDPHETHPDLAHTQVFIAPMVEHWARHGFGYWTVLVPDAWPGAVAGTQAGDDGRSVAGLGGVQHHTVAGRPVLNVYFRFAPEAQGRGLAGAVLRQVGELAPQVAPGCDVVVRTRPANAAARRVAERAGYVDEGLEPGTTDMQLLRWRPPGRGRVSPAGRSGA